MSVARKSFVELLSIANTLDCVGVEVRNDLEGVLFDGYSAQEAAAKARDLDLKILVVAEVKAFNDGSTRVLEQASALMQVASACDATGIALIPRCDGHGCEPAERLHNLAQAVEQLKPLLEQYKLIGFIEPLGFEQSSLRSKREVVEILEKYDACEGFQLVHDTFHHYLAGGGPLFPQHTGMVHVSGVTETEVDIASMRDEHRVLVDQNDRLENLQQLQDLIKGGYPGPVSMEAFAPLVHDFVEPETEISGSFNYIANSVAALNSCSANDDW